MDLELGEGEKKLFEFQASVEVKKHFVKEENAGGLLGALGKTDKREFDVPVKAVSGKIILTNLRFAFIEQSGAWIFRKEKIFISKPISELKNLRVEGLLRKSLLLQIGEFTLKLTGIDAPKVRQLIEGIQTAPKVS